MATKAQIRDRAAQNLGILRIGQSLQYQDQTRLESAYDEVYEDLKDRGEATWASTASVPTKLAPHVAALVAENGLDTFNVGNDRYNRVKIAANTARREIPRLNTPEYEDVEQPTDY